jgi:hypothetical protein
MTSKTELLLTDPQPHSHFVYPSSDEGLVSRAVSVFANTGLRKGDAVVLVTTATRRAFIESQIAADGHNVELLERDGQLTFFDAGALLSTFLGAGMPDG